MIAARHGLLALLTLGVAFLVVVPMTHRPGSSICPRPWSDLIAIECLLDEYAAHGSGSYPASLDELVAPDANGEQRSRSRNQVLLDPWERPYLYEPPRADHPRPRVWTLGADGRPGGAGSDADVDAHTLGR